MIETFKAGDKVKIIDFYLDNYPKWGQLVKDKEATVISAKIINVKFDDLDKDDKPRYKAVYGIQEVYSIFELKISLNDKIHLVSSLGFSKENK